MSLHKFEYDLINNKIIDRDTIPINERIRDIKFDKDTNKLYLFLESGNWYPDSSSIAIIESNNISN